jgi:hypothetical protein
MGQSQYHLLTTRSVQHGKPLKQQNETIKTVQHVTYTLNLASTAQNGVLQKNGTDNSIILAFFMIFAGMGGKSKK